MNTIDNPEYLGSCRELVERAYAEVIQYVRHHSDDVYVFEIDDEGEVIFCMCSNPTVGSSYSEFDHTIRMLEQQGDLVYLNKFAGMGNMSRKGLKSAIDELIALWAFEGYTMLVASVKENHAKAWGRLYGTKNVTGPVMIDGHAELQLITYRIDTDYEYTEHP